MGQLQYLSNIMMTGVRHSLRGLSSGNRIGLNRHLSDTTTGPSRPSGISGHKKPTLLFVDTFQVINELKSVEFTEKQAIIITDMLLNMSSRLMDEQNRTLVSKSSHEITTQQMLSQMAALRKDMVILEKSEFSSLKSENEKLKMDMQLLRQAFREEVDRVANTIKMDLNMEKSRAREEHNKVEAEIIKTQNRIDTTVANLRTSFEKYRNDMFKYAAGTILSCMGIFLSFYRLWK